MSLPKEPRQLMINLMYLVLTALLALNVSNEILHAFKVINQSISESNGSIEGKNKELFDQIAENAKQPGHEKVIPYMQRAELVKKEADDMYNYLEGWKERIIQESGGKDHEGNIAREDNIDATTLLLVDKGGGDTLKRRILALRSFLIGKLDPVDTAAIAKQIPLKIENPKKSDNNPQADWKVSYFHNMPTMAAITLFSKFQNDVRNSESQIIKQLFEEAHSKDFKFDAIKAIAVPRTSYVLAGQKVEADIMLAAYNKTVQPSVTANTGKVNPAKEGVASWEGVASGVGLQTIKGTVSLNMGDRIEKQEYEFKYMVGSTGASIQLDKMNVFYIGVPNPITVSAAGYSLEDISVNIPNAKVEPDAAAGKGHYIVNVSQEGEVNAAIDAKTSTGMKPVGSMKVRVKMIPDPIGEVGGKSGGGMPANIFRAQLGIAAVLKNFDFDARFKVVSFSFSMQPKRGEYVGPFAVNGSRFDGSSDVEKVRVKCKPGDRVFMEDIKAKGPDGRIRTLIPITLLLN